MHFHEFVSCDLSICRNAKMYFGVKQDARSYHLKLFTLDIIKKLQHFVDALKRLKVCCCIFLWCIVTLFL